MSTNKIKKEQNVRAGTFVIFDTEEQYANNLLDYISVKRGMPFRTVAFTELSEMQAYLKGNHVDILLISEQVIDETFLQYDISKIILLSNCNVYAGDDDYSSIFKYQSSENIIREILDYFVALHQNAVSCPIIKDDVKFIGVYSPIGRCGQTTFAITLGQCLAEKYNVLYLNFEEFSSVKRLLDTGYPSDLSDLMYFYLQNPKSIGIKLKAIIGNLFGVDYVPPVSCHKDLREITIEQWELFVKCIATTSEYNIIILDLSNMLEDVIEMLCICNMVYVPRIDDEMQDYKVNAFMQAIREEEYSIIENKITLVEIQERMIRNVDISRPLVSSDFGEYVKKYADEI